MGWSLVLFVALVGGHLRPALGQAPQASPVRAGVVQLEMVSTEQTFVGTVTPIRQATIGSAVEGRVVAVMVEEGDLVAPLSDPSAPPQQRRELKADSTSADVTPGFAGLSAGGTGPEVAGSDDALDPQSLDLQSVDPQRDLDADWAGYPLAQLRTATIDIELDAARSELELRLAMQQELEASLPTDLELAQANRSAAEARLRFALSQLERNQSLAGTNGAVSPSELEQIESAFDAAREDLSAAQAAVRKLENTRVARLAQAAAQVSSQRDAIRLLEDRKSKYTIRAPFEGVVSRRFAEMGQWISVGTDIAEVVQMDPIDVVISVPQGVIRDVQTALAGAIRPDATDGRPAGAGEADSPQISQSIKGGLGLNATVWSDDDLVPLAGQVVALVPSADLLSRTFPVKIRLNNPQTELGFRLNPGMLVRVNLAVGQAQKRLLVDKDALVLNNEGQFVMVIDRGADPPTVTSVPVQLGTAVGARVEVIGQIREWDWVVVEGNERLRSGTTVKVINASSLPTGPNQPPTEIAGDPR